MSQSLDDAILSALGTDLNADGRILNIPCGDGDLSRKMKECGGNVVSSDLFPEYAKLAPGEVIKADMNEPLPFDDDSFDVVVCQEGIEHLENLPRFFAESRRILRDGGRLIVTTPNFMDLSSRLSYFLTGIKGFRGNFANEQSTIWGVADGRVYHGHAFSLPFFQIRYLMRVNHFDAVRIEGIKRSGTARTLYYAMRPFMGFLIGFITNRRTRRDRANRRPSVSDPLQRELREFALSKDLLVGKTLLVDARLSEGSFRPDARTAIG
jgi:SAM-dependent methyltransferase